MKNFSISIILKYLISIIFIASQTYANVTLQEGGAFALAEKVVTVRGFVITKVDKELKSLGADIDKQEAEVNKLKKEQEELWKKCPVQEREFGCGSLDLSRKLDSLIADQDILEKKLEKDKSNFSKLVNSEAESVSKSEKILTEVQKSRMDLLTSGPTTRGKRPTKKMNDPKKEVVSPQASGVGNTEAAPSESLEGTSVAPGMSEAVSKELNEMADVAGLDDMTPAEAKASLIIAKDGVQNLDAQNKIQKIQLDSIKLMLEFDKLEDKLDSTDETLDAIEEQVDKAVLGAYLKDKIGQLMNSQLICKARQRCAVPNDPIEIPASALDEIFPSNPKSSRSEHYEKVNKKIPINRTPAPSAPQTPAEGLE